jgi:hypothetical protein
MANIQNSYGLKTGKAIAPKDVFNLKDLYVQIRCEDSEGNVFVSQNNSFAEMMNDECFVENLVCVEHTHEGSSSLSTYATLMSKAPFFAITEYLWYSYGGGMLPADFDKMRGVSVQLHALHYGSDEKPGF